MVVVLDSFVDVLFCSDVVGSLVVFIPLFLLEFEVGPIPEVAGVDVLGVAVVDVLRFVVFGVVLGSEVVLDSVVVQFPSGAVKLLVIQFSKEFRSHSFDASSGTIMTSSPTIVTL